MPVKLLTMVSPGAMFFSSRTRVTGNGCAAMFVENAVIACLVKGVKVTADLILASIDALLQMGYTERVH